jgi:hypothetical protein
LERAGAKGIIFRGSRWFRGAAPAADWAWVFRAEELPLARVFDNIKKLVAGGRYVVGEHAAERLDERGVLEWQVVDGIEDGSLLAERPDDLPNPAVEVGQTLADGTNIKAVWSHVISANVAKLVTVHYFDE